MSDMSLEDRVIRERMSYDHGSVDREMLALQSRYYHVFKCPNSRRAEIYLDSLLSRYGKGKQLLDYGCYDGFMVERYSKCGAASINGIDISETGICEAINKYGHLASFQVADAHKVPFPDSSFDVVAGRSILHHLDFEVALSEVTRLLRPNGWAIFMEPLGDNPAGKLMRLLTPKARTKDEKPITRGQILAGDKHFGNEAHYYFNLVSVPAAMITSRLRLTPNNFLLRATDMIDIMLSNTIARYWMRQVVLVWQKVPAQSTESE